MFDSDDPDGVADVKQCPICGSKFAGTESFCPHDGAHLIEAEQPAQLLGKTLHDLFKLESLLYKDAFGERYAGRLLDDGSSVKVTIFNQAFAPDASRIASLVTAKTLLDEPMPAEIATTHGWDVEADPAYLVESLAKGPSLRVLLDERGKLDWRTAVKLTCSLARKLEWMDNQGVNHRALQPEVISITQIKRGEVHLGEWALGAISFADNPLEAVQRGQLVPAAAYMAPELIDGSGNADRRSQIYSLGIILYEMLTGKSPFKSAKTEETLKRQRRERPVKLSISYEGEPLPEALDDLFEVMTAKLPEQRFQALGALVNALSSTLDDDTNASDFPEIERDPDTKSIVLKKASNTGSDTGSTQDEPSEKERKQTLLFISADDVKKAREEAEAEAAKNESPEIDDANKSTVQMDSSVLAEDIERAKSKDKSASGESGTSDEPAQKQAEATPTQKKKKKKKSKKTLRLTPADLPETSNLVGIDDPESEPEDTEEPSSSIVISEELIEDTTKAEEKKAPASKGISGSSVTETSTGTEQVSAKKVDPPVESISIQDAIDAADEDAQEAKKPETKKNEKSSTSEKGDSKPQKKSATKSTEKPAPAAITTTDHTPDFKPVDDDQWFSSNSERAWDNEIFMEHEERTNKKFKTYLIVALVIFVLAFILGAVLIATAPEEEEEASLTPQQDNPPTLYYAQR